MGRLFDSPLHLLIIVLVIVIIFGWKRLPDAARSLGRSMRIFKSEVSEMKNDKTDKPASDASRSTVRGQTLRDETVADGQTFRTTSTERPADRPADLADDEVVIDGVRYKRSETHPRDPQA